MDTVTLGASGLHVTKLCLGCMTYGDPKWRDWVLDEAASQPFIRRALDAGINFFDTADVYSQGESERILGRAIREFGPGRDRVVIATKVHGQMGADNDPNQRGLSRKHILSAIDDSLRRLGMDYVDLYQIHRFDPHTPVEETVSALHDVIRAGKARYIGASSMYAWQFQRMQRAAETHGFTRFISMQNHYNLMYREEEREMIPFCAADGVGLIPWSPLARGRLAGAHRAQTVRTRSDPFANTMYDAHAEADEAVIAAVAHVASGRGIPAAQVALAWVSSRAGVAAPIIGASKMTHLDDAIASLSVRLTDDEVAALEAPYVAHPVLGHV